MASKIEWYLVELERMLKGRISDVMLNDLQSETRGHLIKLSEENPGADAETKAIRAFGSPKRLVWRYLRESRVLDRGVLVILLGMSVICYVLPLYLIFEEPIASSFGGFLGWFETLGLFLVFSLWFRGFKPIPIVATLATAALVTTFVMSYRMVFINDPHSVGILTVSQAKRFATRQSSPTFLTPEVESKLKDGLRAFSANRPDSQELSQFRTTAGYLVPSFPAKFGGTKLVWQVNPTYEGARYQWRNWVGRTLEDARFVRERNATVKRLVAAAPPPGIANLWPATKFAFTWAGMAALILLGIHAFTAGLLVLLEWGLIGRRRLA